MGLEKRRGSPPRGRPLGDLSDPANAQWPAGAAWRGQRRGEARRPPRYNRIRRSLRFRRLGLKTKLLTHSLVELDFGLLSKLDNDRKLLRNLHQRPSRSRNARQDSKCLHIPRCRV